MPIGDPVTATDADTGRKSQLQPERRLGPITANSVSTQVTGQLMVGTMLDYDADGHNDDNAPQCARSLMQCVVTVSAG